MATLTLWVAISFKKFIFLAFGSNSRNRQRYAHSVVPATPLNGVARYAIKGKGGPEKIVGREKDATRGKRFQGTRKGQETG